MKKQIDKYVNKNTNNLLIELKDITIQIEETKNYIKIKRSLYKSKSGELYLLDDIAK